MRRCCGAIRRHYCHDGKLMLYWKQRGWIRDSICTWRIGAIRWAVFACSPHSTTPRLHIHSYNIFLTHSESQTQRGASLWWCFLFSSFGHLIFTINFLTSSYLAPTKRVFNNFSARYRAWREESWQKYHTTQICFLKANLQICLLAIETKVLVAIVEHVCLSVSEINNLRYGICQVGAWEASDCYSCECSIVMGLLLSIE